MRPQRTEVTNRLFTLLCLSALVGIGATVFDGSLNAASGAITQADCRVCHAVERISKGVPVVDMAGPHHDLQRANSWNCSYCHNTPETPKAKPLDCLQCHSGTGHAAAHDFVGPPSQGCTNCHDANVVIEHVTNRDFSCSVCHDNPSFTQVIENGRNGVSVTCYDCHTTNDHHARPEAQSGNCTYCHADPRLALDSNAPTGQLACRACHGSYQHGNGGPIQDYGACFACHQPTPYHAKPSSNPSDCNAGFLEAPGKGKFNLFASEFARNMGRRSGDRSSRNCRFVSFRIPGDVNFVTIVDQLGTNQEWVVPTFGEGDGSSLPTTPDTSWSTFGGRSMGGMRR